MTQPATLGDRLLYTYQAIDHCKPNAVGQSRPATVVRDWGSCYNVQVFTDGSNDFDDGRTVLHLTSIQLSDCVAKGRLHWPGSSVDAPEPALTEAAADPLASSGTAVAPPSESVEQVQTTVAPPETMKRKGGRPKKVKP